MVTQKSDHLAELVGSNLSEYQLILASNRGPLEYQVDEDGSLYFQRGAGGVVSALSGLSRFVELEWIACAMREGDRKMAYQADGGRFKVSLEGEKLYLRFVVIPRSVYHKYYSVFCNPLLWFLQHYMWNCSRTPNINHNTYDAWENGYVAVNKAFADAIVEEAAASKRPPIVIINDYHLYLVGGYVKQKLRNVPLQYFIHIPWPTARYWQMLPVFMYQAIIRSLLSADIVGLQTKRDVKSFIACCREFIKEATIDHEQDTVTLNGHTVRVRAYPISVDVGGLKNTVDTDRFREYEEKIEPLLGEQTIVRVDRMEPSKNIIRGFQAFDTLLERHPEFIGTLKFLAFLVPSRTHLGPYQRYSKDTLNLIDTINEKYGTSQWHPIEFFYENDFIQALAGMAHYDVLLVNAVIDGMNLVSKEGPSVNKKDGVLVLSETVGASEQLGEYALTVTPTDLEGTVRALYVALTMPQKEKRQRAQALAKSVAEEDLHNWVVRLIGDITELAAPPAAASS